jgi:S1-C subfamily serine protease
VDLLDVVLIVLLVLASINGFFRGAVLQLATYAGLLLGLLIGALIAPPLARLASSTLAQAAIAFGVLVGMAALGDGIGWAVGARIRSAAQRSALRGVDSVAGSAIAVVALLLATWFIGLNLVQGPFPPLSREIRNSAIVRGLDDVLPEPPPLLSEVSQLLDRFGFPPVFIGIPPGAAGKVPPPPKGAVGDAVRAGEPSTVQIVGQGCGGLLEGTGFVAAEHYVITNAHVVAGIDHPLVQKNGRSQAGIPVLFDPRLDVAVLYVDPTPGPVLSLDPKTVDRGQGGAVMGFPEGGPFRYGAAAVRQEITAVGRDIYGHSRVTRDIYELQALVRPGNSGGPFVLPDGQGAGVVFAGSTTNDDIGYALTSDEVRPKLDQAEGRTGPVGTGACAR